MNWRTLSLNTAGTEGASCFIAQPVVEAPDVRVANSFAEHLFVPPLSQSTVPQVMAEVMLAVSLAMVPAGLVNYLPVPLITKLSLNVLGAVKVLAAFFSASCL